MPTLRPFRALRYDVPPADQPLVLAPPYDVVSPAQRLALLARHPHNAVRIDLPADLGDADARVYHVAAETVSEWRRSGVLVKDAQATVTVHQMRWPGPAGVQQAATGVLARLKLEDFGPASGVLPHERTMSGPKHDRLQLLDATRMNTSPVVFLAGGDAQTTSAALAALTMRKPDVEATTDDGVQQRLWITPAADAAAVLASMSSAPLTIADGHHRYETALAYRAAREAEAVTVPEVDREEDPAWEYLLALVYPLDQAPSVLPTHRVIRGRPCGEDLLERLATFASIDRLADREALLARMAEPPLFAPGASGSGRIGLLTRDKAALLTVDRGATEALLPPGLSEASRGLDVNALSVIIERAYGDDAATMAGDGRLWYVKDAREASQQVVDEVASASFLLHGMPPAAIADVAGAGEVMPHKSTYFYPKAPSGLVFSPFEW